MNELFTWISGFITGAGIVGGIIGWLQIRECADVTISHDPPKWWKRALIMARARKQIEEENG